MVATHKEESENEEIWDKVRARTAVTTDSGEGTTELGQQSVKLMATMTKVGQGKSPASVPKSSRERGHGRGWTDRGTPGHSSSPIGWTSLGETAQDCNTPTDHGAGTTIIENRDRTARGLTLGVRVQPTGEIPTLSSALGARAWTM